MTNVASYRNALSKASKAHAQGRFEEVVALLDPFYKTAENDAMGGLLLAIALWRTARGNVSHQLSNRLLRNGWAGLGLLQLRVLVQYSQADIASAQRALKAVLVYAPGDKGSVLKEAVRVIHDSEDEAVNWFKRAYCLGANDSKVVQILVEHLIKDVTSTDACWAILSQVDEAFRVLWLRHVLKIGLLPVFRNNCPLPGSPFWKSTDRKDLEESRDIIDLFLRLNKNFGDAPATQRVEPPQLHHSSNALLTAMVENILASDLSVDPFSHIFLENMFPFDAYNKLVERAQLTEITWRTKSNPNRGNIVERIPEEDDIWHGIFNILHGDAFLDWVVWRFGVTFLVSIIHDAGFKLIAEAKFTSDRQGYTLGPHKDAPSRFITGLFYVPLASGQEELGTCLYRKKKQGWVFDNGMHGLFRDFNEVKRLPYRDNTGLLFLNMGNSYHGVPRIHRDARRGMIQYNIRIIREDAS